jgi:hypothetical protein
LHVDTAAHEEAFDLRPGPVDADWWSAVVASTAGYDLDQGIDDENGKPALHRTPRAIECYKGRYHTLRQICRGRDKKDARNRAGEVSCLRLDTICHVNVSGGRKQPKWKGIPPVKAASRVELI